MNIFKRLYYHINEKYQYNTYIKKFGITFDEYSHAINKRYADKRFDHNETFLFDKRIKKVDNIGYVHSLLEIFIEEVYLFKANKNNPLIIDCGANIGLSIIYFKKLYPKARIIGFEPDPHLYKVCCHNIDQFGFNDVEINEKAIWTEDTQMSFIPDNSLGGMISDSKDTNSLNINTIRLLPFLTQEIDFLKIDIEGAEVEVLIDCKDSLSNVSHLFVEYHSSTDEKQRLNELLEVLSNAGFRYYIKEATNILLHPFVDYNKLKNSQFDLQLNIFAYRN